MAKKVTGVAVQLGNRKWRFSEESGAPMATEQRATLVVGDERVFTESEVRELLDDVIAWVSGYYFEREEFKAIADRHGVSLDPA